MQWLVAFTQNNAERLACAALTAPYRGFEVYNPQIIKRVAHAGRVRDVVRSFLPRMIFVKDDGSRVRAIKSAPGVSSVMSVGSVPAVLGRWVLDAIRGRETQAPHPDKPSELAFFVDLDPKYNPVLQHVFEPGETLRVIDGPFRSFDAVFEEYDDRKRAQVAVMIFGRSTPVLLEPRQLEKI